MTFLNPLILLGLAAAAIPILLHLLNLRKLRTIEFSTLSFLKELQRTKIRRIKIRQWLLLLLRTLLVILIVMGFSRPTLEGPLAGTFGERAKTTSVFLLDDSQSMTATDEQGEFLQQANDAALQVAGLLKEGDEVFLLRLSEVNAVAAGSTVQPIRNFELLRSTLQTIRPSYHHNTLEDALRLSAKLLAGSTNFNKEVYLFSDFQSGAIASKNSVAIAPEQLFAETVNVFMVEVGKRTPNNLGIESISVPTSIVEPGKAFLVRARLSNAGERAVDGFIVSLFLDGERVAQQSIDIASGSFADVEFTAVPKSPGILEGMVELESDDLEFDNRRYFTLEIPAEVRVLFVGSPADLQYLKLALTARETSAGSALQLREVTDERLAASDIGAADVIIFSNPRDLSAAQADRLESFLKSGRGMLVVPGPLTQPNNFNAGFAAKLQLPTISGIEQLQDQRATSGTESFLTFDRVELRHPIFQGMFEEEPSRPAPRREPHTARSIESPEIKTVARYQLPAHARTIISLSNGGPFLAELPVHNGRVLLLSVAANLEWSDFPLKGLFVPLLHRSVSYLAQSAQQRVELLVGEEATLRTRARTADRWIVVSPTKIEAVLHPSQAGLESVVRFGDTETPGIYAVKGGQTITQKFVVNMHPDESRTMKAEAAELTKMFERLGIAGRARRLDATPDIQRVIMQARFGVELWKHFFIAALFVAIVEMIVARESKQELASLHAT